MRVLITGIAGKIGRLVAADLLANDPEIEIIGIDRRPWPQAPEAIELHRVDIRKRGAEEVFRRSRPEAVIHMATVTHLTHRSEERYKINLYGTRAVWEHCHRYGARSAIFVGRHTYYGAAPDAPLYHKEDDPPNAVKSFPELSDLVAADLYAGAALWRYPELDTCVLRICYSLGPQRHGTLATFLAGPNVPTILGFDPLFQFMHSDDIAAAIGTALRARLRGVFNVAGPQPLPLSLLIEQTGRRRIPVPEVLFRLALGRFGLPRLPRGALEHIKHPVIIDASTFREKTGFAHRHSADATMESFRRAHPPG